MVLTDSAGSTVPISVFMQTPLWLIAHSHVSRAHLRPGDVLQQLVLKRTDQVLPHYIVHLEPRRAAPAVAPAPAPNVAAYNLAYQQQLALLRQQLQPAIQPTKVKGRRGRRW
jgi:hypothetical protein